MEIQLLFYYLSVVIWKFLSDGERSGGDQNHKESSGYNDYPYQTI